MAKDYKYSCVNCGKEYSNKEIIYLCPSCKLKNREGFALQGVLKVIYPYEQIKVQIKAKKSHLKDTRYIDLLPIKCLDSMPFLEVGNTPLYSFEQKSESNFFGLHLKVDSGNPTFSFKDRASALVSAFAKENKIDIIVAASTGNAGSSLAGICASQKQKAIILVPENAPKAKLTQVLMYGAELIAVKGTYDDAYDLSLQLSEKYGWYNRNTAFNPLTIEGKKTVSFELFDQMQKAPDKIFVPTGDGVIIAAVYKGYEDLLKMGLINKMPIIYAVQAEGSSNLIDNLNSEDPHFESSHTIADSISVDIPRNYYMAKQYLNTFQGSGIKVSDHDIILASKELSREFGIFVEPAAAAAYAGFLTYKKSKQIQKNEQLVVLLTGNGLKDISSVSSVLKYPDAVDPKSFNYKQKSSI